MGIDKCITMPIDSHKLNSFIGLFSYMLFYFYYLFTVMTISFPTDWSGQTVQTEIRLLLEEQSDQGLHCLLFHLHLFDEIPYGFASLFEFKVNNSKVF